MANQFQRFELSQKEEEKFRILDPSRRELLTALISAKYSIEELPELIAAATSHAIEEQYRGYVGMRRLMSTQNPPLEEYMRRGLVQLLPAHINGNKQLHLETLRVFTFLASGSEVQSAQLIREGALPFLLAALEDDEHAIALEGTWAIANLMGDSNENRNVCMEYGIIDTLLRLMSTATHQERYASLVWALSNICRGKPLQEYAVVRPILMTFAEVCGQLPLDDIEMIEEVIWSLCNYAETHAEVKDALVRHNSLPRLLAILAKDDRRVQVPSSLLLQELVRHSQDYGRQCIQNPDFLTVLQQLLGKTRTIRSVVIGVLKELLAYPSHQLQPILTNEALWQVVFDKFSNDRVEIRLSIIQALRESLKGSARLQAMQLFIRHEVVGRIIREVDNLNDECLNAYLDFLYTLLISGEREKDNGTNIVQLDLLSLMQSAIYVDSFQKLQCLQSEFTLEIYYRIRQFLA